MLQGFVECMDFLASKILCRKSTKPVYIQCTDYREIRGLACTEFKFQFVALEFYRSNRETQDHIDCGKAWG